MTVLVDKIVAGILPKYFRRREKKNFFRKFRDFIISCDITRWWNVPVRTAILEL